MLHPRRLLQDLVDGELPDRRRIGVERHVARCSSCAASVARLRGLKSALLGLHRPAPDPEFQRRLLDRGTSGPPASRIHGQEAHTGSTAAFVRDHHAGSGPHSRRRTAAAAAGGTVVVAGAILGSAYIVGSEAGSTTVEAAGGATSLRAGWESVAPRTPTTLDARQLDTLRAGGWYCPELESLGYSLRSAEGITVDGRPTLELTLENDGSTVTVYEQRKVGDEGGRAAEPFSAVSGRLVTADGFEHVGGAERDLWVRSGEPWQVVLDSPTVTYTVVSSMPAAAMPQTLSQLVTTEHAQLSLAPQSQEDSMMERIVRGLSMIAHNGGTSR